MCTVSFIPGNDRIYLSSNRDEKITRLPARPPAVYTFNGYQLLYPLDPLSNGSWIAARDTGDAAVLLNGGFVKHVSLGGYRKSRGTVFIEMIGAIRPVAAFAEYDCNNIEPFTLVLYVDGNLSECRWDGGTKHIHEFDTGIPRLWSSATLYDGHISAKRQGWFDDWLNSTTQINTASIIDFHRSGGSGDRENDFVMNRRNQLQTVSITSISIGDKAMVMDYVDLRNDCHEQSTLRVLPTPSIIGRVDEQIK